MIRIVVSGAGGRMGMRLLSCACEDKDLSVSGALEKEGHPSIGKNVGEALGLGKKLASITHNLREILRDTDVLIEFTAPDATMRHLKIMEEAKKAMVIGTTGLNQDELKAVEKASRSIPIVMAPNMSIGVNLLFNLVGEVAKGLGKGYDVEIVEAHHRFKKDAPSGTANKLAEKIAAALNRDLAQVGVYGRKGLTGERRDEEIGIHAVRAGDIVGEHTVTFCGNGERIEIIHRAHSRDAFAKGALRAAKFVFGKPPRLYSMENVLWGS